MILRQDKAQPIMVCWAVQQATYWYLLRMLKHALYEHIQRHNGKNRFWCFGGVMRHACSIYNTIASTHADFVMSR